jgi:hypothetical protein
MSTIQQRFVPKIRSIEQKRLANYRGKKKWKNLKVIF